ncbi:MAG: toxin FitB [Pseudomonadota bacterium]|nr:toxin FitB [Pseudomonadota bacterium]
MNANSPRGYLLDTNILSAFAPNKPALSLEFTAWLRAHSDRLFVPCIAIAELDQGVSKLRRAGSTVRAEQLTDWLEGLINHYAQRILPLDAASSRLAGRLADQAIAAGQYPGLADTVIAALAQQAGLIVLTGNIRHFTALGVECINPFEQLPDV